MKPTKTSSLVCLSAVLQCIHPTAAAATSPLADLGYTAVEGTQNASTGCVQLEPSKSSVHTYLTACTGSTLFWGSHTLLRLWATFAGTMMSNVLVGMATIDMSSRRAPVPIELGNTTSFGKAFDASTQGPTCVQGQPAWFDELLGGDASSASEDCLILDVFTPSNSSNESLPVLLWIHGGGYTFGDASNAGGPNFVSSSNGSMIFVSIQYRLGAYGFLSSDDVTNDGSPNAGLLDQRAAIDWVHRHIHAFGGDPSKVCAKNFFDFGRSLTASR
jgi:hypothetical protein